MSATSRGITLAASIGTMAAIGIAVGLGQIWIAAVSLLVVWIILFVLGHFSQNGWDIEITRRIMGRTWRGGTFAWTIQRAC